jgi:hypothetical protein
MRQSMQFYCFNMFRASICPLSGVQLINGCLEDVAQWATFYEQCSLQETLRYTTQAAFQVWPPKSRSYLFIVLLTVGILMPETCCGIKIAYFVTSSWFFTFTMSMMLGHMNIIFVCVCCDIGRMNAFSDSLYIMQ